jgi:hypothetical protein
LRELSYATVCQCPHIGTLVTPLRIWFEKELERDASRRGLVIFNSGRTVEVIAEMPTDISIHKLNFQLNTPLTGLSAPHSSPIYIGQLEDNYHLEVLTTLLIGLDAIKLSILLAGSYHGFHVRWKVQT